MATFASGLQNRPCNNPLLMMVAERDPTMVSVATLVVSPLPLLQAEAWALATTYILNLLVAARFYMGRVGNKAALL
ncbi:hypothetical protein LPJ57_003591 [Coemansia sp. RSA 486]|nr:hypothetical protein LPJ57_003591 [Coemansia sp. RSA 486]